MLTMLRTIWASLFGGGAENGKFLCDSCRYDYGNVCRRPERPNAKRCSDYKRAG